MIAPPGLGIFMVLNLQFFVAIVVQNEFERIKGKLPLIDNPSILSFPQQILALPSAGL
jgi:hypothetical protein